MMTGIADLMNRLRGRMTCAETLVLLQQHLDGELSAEEARKVAAHLDSCSMCDDESGLYDEIKRSIAFTSVNADAEVIARLERFGERVGNDAVAD